VRYGSFFFTAAVGHATFLVYRFALPCFPVPPHAATEGTDLVSDTWYPARHLGICEMLFGCLVTFFFAGCPTAPPPSGFFPFFIPPLYPPGLAKALNTHLIFFHFLLFFSFTLLMRSDEVCSAQDLVSLFSLFFFSLRSTCLPQHHAVKKFSSYCIRGSLLAL